MLDLERYRVPFDREGAIKWVNEMNSKSRYKECENPLISVSCDFGDIMFDHNNYCKYKCNSEIDTVNVYVNAEQAINVIQQKYHMKLNKLDIYFLSEYEYNFNVNFFLGIHKYQKWFTKEIKEALESGIYSSLDWRDCANYLFKRAKDKNIDIRQNLVNTDKIIYESEHKIIIKSNTFNRKIISDGWCLKEEHIFNKYMQNNRDFYIYSDLYNYIGFHIQNDKIEYAHDKYNGECITKLTDILSKIPEFQNYISKLEIHYTPEEWKCEMEVDNRGHSIFRFYFPEYGIRLGFKTMDIFFKDNKVIKTDIMEYEIKKMIDEALQELVDETDNYNLPDNVIEVLRGKIEEAIVECRYQIARSKQKRDGMIASYRSQTKSLSIDQLARYTHEALAMEEPDTNVLNYLLDHSTLSRALGGMPSTAVYDTIGAINDELQRRGRK